MTVQQGPEFGWRRISHEIPEFALARADAFLRPDPRQMIPMGTARLAYHGLDCFAHTFIGVIEITPDDIFVRLGAGAPRLATEFGKARWGDPRYASKMFGASAPHGMRPRCKRAAAAGLRFLHLSDVIVHRQPLPGFHFAQRSRPIGVWEMPPKPQIDP